MLDRPDLLSGGIASDGHGAPLRQKRERQKMIVRTKKGEIYYGICFALNKATPGFHLDLQDKMGRSLNRTQHILFNDIKAVFYVKSFDGRFNPEDYPPPPPPPNPPIVIEFVDDEVFIGRPASAHWREEPLFFVTPDEQDSNNLMALVERSAIKEIHDLATYKKHRNEEFTAFMREHRKPGMSKEECLGDFYFSKHDYKNALRHYRTAREEEGLSDSLKKKLCASKYNLGMRHIKQKDYVKALKLMELALEISPDHEKALRKAKQLRAHLAKHQSDPELEEHNPLL